MHVPSVGENENVDNRETRPGYLVVYPDGYRSWSPKEVFETAYRKLTTGERVLVSGEGLPATS
jgi:hypothetical protein